MKKDQLQSSKQPSLWQTIREFFYGMFGMEIAEHALEMRGSLESLFMLGTVGDMIGVPILPPYYSLRLLPYIVPNISTWKRRVLRERESDGRASAPQPGNRGTAAVVLPVDEDADVQRIRQRRRQPV